jgi:hypothetical protein
LYFYACCQRSALPQVWVLKTVYPVAMMKRNLIMKLMKSFLERVRPQTEADSELQLKLQRQAHTCGNALLAAAVLLGLSLTNLFPY